MMKVVPSDFVYFANYDVGPKPLINQGAATTMDVDDEEDPVPEITKAHFEEAMKFARR